MNDKNHQSDPAMLVALGARLAAQRLALDLTQAEVAEQAGISKRTLERLEAGAVSTQLASFLRVCRVLGLQDRVEALVPEPAASPLAQLKLKKGSTRKRASGQSAEGEAKPAKPWTWQP
jgi:transcriptional regulator with XRE-family HTH domain